MQEAGRLVDRFSQEAPPVLSFTYKAYPVTLCVFFSIGKMLFSVKFCSSPLVVNANS